MSDNTGDKNPLITLTDLKLGKQNFPIPPVMPPSIENKSHQSVKSSKTLFKNGSDLKSSRNDIVTVKNGKTLNDLNDDEQLIDPKMATSHL